MDQTSPGDLKSLSLSSEVPVPGNDPGNMQPLRSPSETETAFLQAAKDGDIER